MGQRASGPLPEERVFSHDWPSLSDLELLALVFGPGCPPDSAWRRAERLLEVAQSTQRLAELTHHDLLQAGVGHRQALAFQAATELIGRIMTNPITPGESFNSSRQVFDHFHPRVRRLDKECFWELLLDGKNRIQKIVRISEGSLTSSLVHPREVYRPAIQEGAASLLFVHNHPSGDPAPSQEDIQITRRLVETGKIVGIRVLDHVIIGGLRYYSFADQSLL